MDVFRLIRAAIASADALYQYDVNFSNVGPPPRPSLALRELLGALEACDVHHMVGRGSQPMWQVVATESDGRPILEMLPEATQYRIRGDGTLEPVTH